MPHLTKYMPKPKNARRLIPDPENEPDFAELSEMFPLESNSDSKLAAVKQAPPLAEVEATPQPLKQVIDLAGALKIQSLNNALGRAGLAQNVASARSALPARVASNNNAAAAEALLRTLGNNPSTPTATRSLLETLSSGPTTQPPNLTNNARTALLTAALGAAKPAPQVNALAAALAPHHNPGVGLGLNVASASLFQRRQQLLEQAAALENQAKALQQDTVLLNAAYGFQRPKGNYFGGLPF